MSIVVFGTIDQGAERAVLLLHLVLQTTTGYVPHRPWFHSKTSRFRTHNPGSARIYAPRHIDLIVC